MKMANRIFIAIALLGTSLAGTTWSGTVATGFLYDLNVSAGQYLGSTYFAQNNQKNPPDNASVDDASKIRKDTSRPTTLTQEKKSFEKTKPVKPFVPSETIPADQEVDFPYDI